MTVFIVTEHEPWECRRIVGVFASRASAESYVATRPKEEVLPPLPEYGIHDEHRTPISHDIDEYEVCGSVMT